VPRRGIGHSGLLGSGDAQWMTAGSAILHRKMPEGDPVERMHGFQLSANLPASLQMTDPREQDVLSEAIPEVAEDDGTQVRTDRDEHAAGAATGVHGNTEYKRNRPEPSISRSPDAPARSGSPSPPVRTYVT
jgi:quercetin 2,3-dioxygenase